MLKQVNLIGLGVVVFLLSLTGASCLAVDSNTISISPTVLGSTSLGLVLVIVTAYFRIGLPDPRVILPPKD